MIKKIGILSILIGMVVGLFFYFNQSDQGVSSTQEETQSSNAGETVFPMEIAKSSTAPNVAIKCHGTMAQASIGGVDCKIGCTKGKATPSELEVANILLAGIENGYCKGEPIAGFDLTPACKVLAGPSDNGKGVRISSDTQSVFVLCSDLPYLRSMFGKGVKCCAN